MDQKYWLLTAFWILYFSMHSVGATPGIKKIFEDGGLSKSIYRKLYVILSTLGLLAILIYSSTFSESYIIQPNRNLKFVSLVLAALGTIIIRIAFKQYSLREFLGLVVENPSEELKVKGILSYIRHPIYSGIILIILGYLIYIPKLSSLILTVIVFLYLAVGIYLEEKKLKSIFGSQYVDYKKRVPALIPRIKNIISF